MAKRNLMASRINKTNAPDHIVNQQKEQEHEEAKKKETVHPAKPQKERKPLFKKKEKTLYKTASGTKKQADDFSYEKFEAELDAETTQKDNRSEMAAETKKHMAVWAQVLIIILSIYTCFLIYGLFLTNYVYDTNGNVTPEVMTVNDLQALNDYKSIQTFYLRTRNLYEDTLKLDYQLSQHPEESLMVSMGYTKLLETVDKLAVDISAAQFDAQYTAIYSQFKTWTTTDIALYLQYMAKAIANNDATAANNAIIARDAVYNDFALITSNIAKLATTIKGTGRLDFDTWTPDSYIESLMMLKEK